MQRASSRRIASHCIASRRIASHNLIEHNITQLEAYVRLPEASAFDVDAGGVTSLLLLDAGADADADALLLSPAAVAATARLSAPAPVVDVSEPSRRARRAANTRCISLSTSPEPGTCC